MNNDLAPKLSSAPVDRSLFILVVDDERRIADTLATILVSKGYTSEAAYDGASALAVCGRCVPNLLVSDVVMPEMDGIELAIAVSRDFPDCKILLFSGQAAAASMVSKANASGHQFELLAKPVHPLQLLDRVAELIGRPGDISANKL